MENDSINLKGKICPYPVVDIIRAVEKMRSGETLVFIVDDPLCIKSVPDEIEEYSDVSTSIKKITKGWEITIHRG